MSDERLQQIEQTLDHMRTITTYQAQHLLSQLRDARAEIERLRSDVQDVTVLREQADNRARRARVRAGAAVAENERLRDYRHAEFADIEADLAAERAKVRRIEKLRDELRLLRTGHAQADDEATDFVELLDLALTGEASDGTPEAASPRPL